MRDVLNAKLFSPAVLFYAALYYQVKLMYHPFSDSSPHIRRTPVGWMRQIATSLSVFFDCRVQCTRSPKRSQFYSRI